MPRSDGRNFDQLRPLKLQPHFSCYPEGSVLIDVGETRVLCNASILNELPRWRVEKQQGWVTAEYAMLPRATVERNRRETVPSSRSQEIRRLIGRSLRQAVDLELLGPRTCTIDCDVLQADGGTRCAAITGAYVALSLALGKLIQAGEIPAAVLKAQVAAVSVGLVAGEALLDLCYQEDSRAAVDANIVMTAAGGIIEIQGTAEESPFSRPELNQLLDLAWQGLQQIFTRQQDCLKSCISIG